MMQEPSTMSRPRAVAPLRARIENTPDHSEWDAFVASTPGGDLVQTSRWARVKCASQLEVARLVVRSDDTIVAGAQIMCRRVRGLGAAAYIPYGPLVTADPPAGTLPYCVDALRRWVRSHKIRALVVQPPQFGEATGDALRAAGFETTHADVAPSASVRIDLTLSPAEITADMAPQTRKDFKRSLKAPIDLRTGGLDDLASFHDLYCTTAHRHEFPPLPLEYFERLLSELAPGEYAHLTVASHEGTDVAASICTRFGDVVTGRFSGFDPDRLPPRVRPNEALVWAAGVWGAEHGARWLDLGGAHRDEVVALASEVPHEHGSSRKSGMGGTPVLFPEPCELIPNPVLRAGRKLMDGNATTRKLRKSFEQRVRRHVHKQKAGS